jgi:hypothetical protein
MYNQDVLNKIIDVVGTEKATQFCEIAALMYDIKYNACKAQDGLCEYDYERDWWANAFIELKKDVTI